MIRKILTAPARFMAFPFQPIPLDYILSWVFILAILIALVFLIGWAV